MDSLVLAFGMKRRHIYENACSLNWSVVNQRESFSLKPFSVTRQSMWCLILCSKSLLLLKFPLIYACRQMIMLQTWLVESPRNSVLNLIKLNDHNRMRRLKKENAQCKVRRESPNLMIRREKSRYKVAKSDESKKKRKTHYGRCCTFDGNGWNVNNCWTLVLFYFG